MSKIKYLQLAENAAALSAALEAVKTSGEQEAWVGAELDTKTVVYYKQN